MNPLFASLWYALVVGFGVGILLDAWCKHLLAKGWGRTAFTIFIASRGWGIVPIVYSLPLLIDQAGLLGLFGLVPGWSLGMEAIAQDFFGFSFVDLFGIEWVEGESLFGVAEVGWIVLGAFVLLITGAIHGAVGKHDG